MSDAQKLVTEDRKSILSADIAKVNDEIKTRIEEEDRWFDYKIIEVGALLAAFLAHFAFGKENNAETKLNNILWSNATCSALALACVLAITIDIHIRNSMTVINQLGSWIAYYAEPSLLHSCFQNSAGHLLLWENFLRIPGAMHFSTLYSFTFWPHLHFLTWVLYILYLVILLNVMRHREHHSSEARRIALAGFVLVHASLAVFAWGSHLAPSTFEFKVIPDFDWALHGVWPPLLYTVPAILLAALNAWYAGFLPVGGKKH